MAAAVDSTFEQIVAHAWPDGPPPRLSSSRHHPPEHLEIAVRLKRHWYFPTADEAAAQPVPGPEDLWQRDATIDEDRLADLADLADLWTAGAAAPTRADSRDGFGGTAAADRIGASERSQATSPSQPAPQTPDPDCAGDEEIAALFAALDRLAAQPPAELAPSAALARARALLRAQQRLEALSLRAITDVDTRKLYVQEDRPSTTDWVKAQDIPGLGGKQVTLAKRLRRLPTVQEAVLACRLSSTAAAAVGTAVSKAGPHLDRPGGLIDGLDAEAALYGVLVDGVCTLLAEQSGGATAHDPQQEELRAELESINDPALAHRPRVEAAFVLFAQRIAPELLTSGLNLLLDALLPNEHGKRAQRAGDERGFELHRKHGGSGWTARGELDDETGELLATVLDAAAATDPANPTDTTAWRDGKTAVEDDTLSPDDWPVEQPRPRSRRQQRHDALKRGLQALLSSGALGVRGKTAPQFVVVVENDYLHAVPGALPGRTVHGARLHRDQLRKLLCDSTFTRMVRDARKKIIEVSHTQRTLTALERLVLHVQTGGSCGHCGKGPADGVRLRPHHPELFSNTGVTSLEDTINLCEPSHDHQLHGQGRSITLLDGRVLGPDGWIRREPRQRP